MSSYASRKSHLEVIPDSEEERQRPDEECSRSRKFVEVIDISSSDDSDCGEININQYTARSKQPFHKSSHRNRRIIESSDEDSPAEVIELSDSSVEVTFVRSTKTPSKPPDALPSLSDPHSPRRATLDESIIILNPPSARTPLRNGRKNVHKTPHETPGTPNNTVNELSSNKTRQISSPGALNTLSTPVAQRPSVEKTPRTNTKKSREQAELQQRREYAEQLFIELNNSVFKQGLPENTKLNWSKRLLTTAGKAKYHRSRNGVTTTEIELAEKILDCDERIKNTLSHEMCHLATWVIDDKVTEHHGKFFKAWASRVMKIRPDIDVSIKHNYEISYPFEWECQLCSKVYGRFSKSIRPDECFCGVCKEGRLIPLFPTKRPATTSKLSRMAAAKPQDSPRPVQNTSSVKGNLLESESDPDFEDAAINSLAKIMSSTSIAD